MELIENSLILIAVVILVEVIKYVINDKYKRYLPLISVIIGILAQVSYDYMTIGFTADSFFYGVIIGGAAAGIYDVATKTVLNK